jgi:TonB-linked SusC/RagA family outer membrane protein
MDKNKNVFRTTLLKMCSKQTYRIIKLTTFLLMLTIMKAIAGNTTLKSARLNFEMNYVASLNDLKTLGDQNELNYAILDPEMLPVKRESRNPLNLQQNRITGIVTDKDGNPMPGVNVVVTGINVGVMTDNNGKYSIEVPGGAKSLTFSFVGMQQQEITIGALTQINVSMGESQIGLEEVVVIGYGTQKKKDLTGAISQIDPAKMEDKITSNVTDLLRSSIAGVNIPLSIDPKGSVDMAEVLIRGIKSLKASNTPLIVLDGMIYEGDLADISSFDIERIDVMKDASSAAVYGSRSSNGVISITTKKGKQGTPTISMSVNTGFATPSFIRPALSPEEYIDMRTNLNKQFTPRYNQPGYYNNPNNLPAGVTLDQWKAYSGATGDQTDIWLSRLSFQPIEIDNYKNGKTIDWADKIFQTGFRQDYLTSINGGSDRTVYYWSLNYTDNGGFVVGEKYNSIRSRVNLESKIANFLTVGLNAQIANRDESSIPANWVMYYRSSPYGSMYNADGTLTYFVHGDPLVINPFASRTYNNLSNKFKDLNSKIYAIVSLPLGFSYQINLINNFTDQRNYYHISSSNPGNSTGGYASRENTNTYSWTIDNIIKWSKTIGIHNFDLTLLANREKWQNWYNLMENSKFFPSDILGYHNMNAGTAPKVSSNDMSSTRDALLARLNYTLNAKYFLTLSVRQDGYSAFGKANRHGLFPSAALAWKISDEKFFNLKSVDFLKLRISWGANGNSAIDSYAALAAMNSGKYLLADNNGSAYSVSMLQISKLANDDLKWEKTTSTNFGFDFGLFNSRLTGSFESYLSKTTNLLVDRSLPSVTGFQSIASNLGQINNMGIELTLNSVNLDLKGKLFWQTSFNFSIAKNKIVHLYGDMVNVYDKNGNVIGQKEADDYVNNWFIGKSTDAIWDYLPNGIWQKEDSAMAYSYGGYTPGQYRYVDVNNDGQYTQLEDKGFLGHTKPQYYMTITNDFIINKNISVGFTLYGKFGWKMNFKDRAGQERENNYDLPYWTAENRSNEWSRLELRNDETAVLSRYIDAGFVRLSNIYLGYTVPQKVTNYFHVKLLKILGSFQNVGLWTKWPGWDPEYPSGPVPRYYNLTINVNF